MSDVVRLRDRDCQSRVAGHGFAGWIRQGGILKGGGRATRDQIWPFKLILKSSVGTSQELVKASRLPKSSSGLTIQ